MDHVPARHEAQQELDVTELILRRIAIAPHPLTLADVRMAEDGGATLDPADTFIKLVELCETGVVDSAYDHYPKCIMTKGHCPPQTVYTITDAGKKLLSEHATKN